MCKDRTLSVTDGAEKPFNGVAIAVYSVDTREEAMALVMTLGSLQHTDHPSKTRGQLPHNQWRKIAPDKDPFVQHIEYEHLLDIQAKIRRLHLLVRPALDRAV